MHPNVFLKLLIGLYASLWVLMSPYRSLCVLMDFNGSLWVLIGPYASLRVLTFFLGPYEPLLILIDPYGFL